MRHRSLTPVVASAALLIAACSCPLPTQAGGFNPFYKPTSVEKLATEIDKLERHIDRYGSVVAKKPDVWGEARLTRHRREFEEVMADELKNFKSTINASLSRSDQAFLANSFALSAAVSGGGSSGGGGGGGDNGIKKNKGVIVLGGSAPSDLVDAFDTTQAITTSVEGDRDFTKEFFDRLFPPPKSPPPAPPEKIEPQPLPDVPFKLADTAFTRTEVRSGSAFGFGEDGIALEPTILLDQLKRYLDHLHEIRRMNEGDDNGDAPGYTINLVRIPVSVLPGKMTRKGYGAEISVTAQPYLSEKTLPKTFRRWVINDLVDELSLPVVKLAEGRIWESILEMDQAEKKSIIAKTALVQAKRNYDQAVVLREEAEKAKKAADIEYYNAIAKFDKEVYEKIKATDNQSEWNKLSDTLYAPVAEAAPAPPPAPAPAPAPEAYKTIWQLRDAPEDERTKVFEFFNKVHSNSDVVANAAIASMNNAAAANANLDRKVKAAKAKEDEAKKIREEKIRLYDEAIRTRQEVKFQLNTSFQSFNSRSRARRASYSVPSSLRRTVYGDAYVFDSQKNDFIKCKVPQCFVGECGNDIKPEIKVRIPIVENRLVPVAKAFYDFHHGESPTKQLHQLDARDFVSQELKAAYEFLEQPEHHFLWELCARIPDAVLGGRDLEIAELQQEFATYLETCNISQRSTRVCPHSYRIVEDLAWCILVEASLLNKALVDDMHRVAQDKNCPCVLADGYMQFYLPSETLPPETTFAFHEYVKCRWPLKVFALDPESQDQNVADTFSLRRELQLAASVAFASGQLNAQNFSQFARRIELDTETIALNRTAVGFSHGEDTFGWRFYPRFQSPDTPGTIGAFGETLFGGPSRKKMMKQRQLEPGIRDCVAIVVAPSFVPYATFNTRTNWFKLTSPNHKEFSLADSVKTGRDIVELQQCKAQCVEDAHMYRDGTVYRLMNAVGQLEKRLPLQTAYVEMPIEDSKGGFQALASGLTSLGPELYGFYGQPGYDASKDNSSFFVVGDNFSIHDTRVIAGGHVLNNDNVGTEQTQVYMLSRQLLRITIPKGVATFKDNQGNEVLDVHVATPYGVSAHMHIPVVGGTPAATPTGYQLNETGVQVSYCWKNVCGKDQLVLGSAAPQLKIKWDEATGNIVRKVKVKFTFDVQPPLAIEQEFTLTNQNDKEFSSQDNKLAIEILKRLNDSGRYDANTPPDAVVLKTKSITVTPIVAGTEHLGSQAKKIAQSLTITLKKHPNCSCPPSCQDGACVDCKDIPAANWNMKKGMTLAMTPSFDKESKLEKLELSQGPEEFVIENELPDDFSPVLTQIKLCVTLQNSAGKKLESRFCPSDCVKVKGGKITISKGKLQDWLNTYIVKDLENSWTKDFDAKTMSIKTYLRHIKTRDCTLVVKVDDDLNFEISAKSGDNGAQFWNDLPPAVSQNPESSTRSALQLSDRPRFDRGAEERRKIFYAPASQR
ncbi:hypothetical protein [Symmachiella dynata]|uniref:hypothetical protein n=1 Tax=Symmachiella dynata TaxID=2527995 RepID=UPI0030EEF4CC